jgi:hypothetical protein
LTFTDSISIVPTKRRAKAFEVFHELIRRRIFGRVRDGIAAQVRQFVREASRGESFTT